MPEDQKKRGRPKKYLTEEDKKEALKIMNKVAVKKYWDSKDKDNIKKVELREYNKLRYQELYKDPEFKAKERERKLQYYNKKNELIKDLKKQIEELSIKT